MERECDAEQHEDHREVAHAPDAGGEYDRGDPGGCDAADVPRCGVQAEGAAAFRNVEVAHQGAGRSRVEAGAEADDHGAEEEHRIGGCAREEPEPDGGEREP